MRRLLLLLPLLLPIAGRGQSPPDPAHPAAPILDIREFGAIASTVPANGYEPLASARANRLAIQRAIDYVPPDGKPLAAIRVYFPPGVWPIDRPLRVDRSRHYPTRVSLVGEGDGLSIIRLRKGQGYDGIVVGMDRAPTRPDYSAAWLDPGHLVPLDELLDGSAKGRRGFRTLGKAHLGQQAGHFDRAGDWYAGVRCLTLDVAFIAPDNVASITVPLCGLRNAGLPAPWYLVIDRGRPVLATTITGDPDDWENGTYRDDYFFGQLATPGLNRLTVVCDLDGGQMRARLNGVSLTWFHRQGPPPAPSDRLFANQHAPFRIGPLAATIDGARQVGDPCDVTFCGLKVSREPVYTPDFKRLDGKPDSDMVRLFDATTRGLVGLLPLTDDPADATADRMLTTLGPGGEGYVNECGLYILDDALHGGPAITAPAGPIRGLTVDGGDVPYGRGLAIGSAYHVDVRDCTLTVGASGIGWFTTANPSYPVRIEGCTLAGSDAPLYLCTTSKATVRDCSFESPASRATIRALSCDDLLIDGAFAQKSGRDFGIVGRRSSMTIRRVGWDDEGQGGAEKAVIYETPAEDKQGVTGLTIDGVGVSSAGPRASAVVLGAPEGRTGRPVLNDLMGDCPVRIDGLSMHKDYTPPKSADAAGPAQVRVTPRASGIWRDGGIRLSPLSAWPAFAGPPLATPDPAPTTTTR